MMGLGVEARVRHIYAFLCEGGQCHGLFPDTCLYLRVEMAAAAPALSSSGGVMVIIYLLVSHPPTPHTNTNILTTTFAQCLLLTRHPSKHFSPIIYFT